MEWSQEESNLYLAAGSGSVSQVSLYLEQGVNLNTPGPDSRLTPLMLAAMRGHIGVVTVLLQNGADPNCRTPRGDDAMMLAAKEGKYEVINVLAHYVPIPLTVLLEMGRSKEALSSI